MRVKISFEFEIPDYLPHTKKQVKEWVRFELGELREMNRSPIDKLDLWDMLRGAADEAKFKITE
ncbi:hypothetical protein EGT74_24440 [Chitinophaga lutea]|uniref:Uncharacterized protein n=1 Tax=Chitinophaga lutea TaxID=2488634 RepID=A0A3N4PBC2_9BACT|nr:hypothetical protein [Chitinophaga lutea]RPE05536.1 hypothetical protein EGT74_24440 [Chitinophaga lutea]